MSLHDWVPYIQIGLLALAAWRELRALCREPREGKAMGEAADSGGVELLSVGQVARRLGADSWQVRRLFERGLLPEPERVGPYRVIRADRVAEVEAALRKAGFLK